MKPFFFEYVNGHFSVENNTRGSTYSVNLKEYNDDDDGGTVIDRKLIIFNNNNINTNSRFNHGAIAVDTTAAIVVIIPLAVAVLRDFMCVRSAYPAFTTNNGAAKN